MNDKKHGHWRAYRPHGRGKPRFLFFRLATVFGVMALLVAAGMAALAFVITRFFGGDGRVAVFVWIGGCSLSLALPLLAALVAVRAFRRIATPLADVMAAADAVAEGDLSARVPEERPGEFGQLARSFNRMARELERADEQRRNLTADVAHELRTPLHIIQGNLEGLLDGVYEPSAGHINDILEETRQLARLVEDLRILSLAEAGQMLLEQEPVNVGELLADVATSFSGQAEMAGITITVEANGEWQSAGDRPSLTIIGDTGRLDQVISNLVANALQHTPTGGRIILRAMPVAGRLRIQVQDTGEGIPPDTLPFIFDRFWRGDRSRTHAGGAGSGLGLAIARQLVLAHHGRIWVDSQPGQGATFTVELGPYGQADFPANEHPKFSA